MGNPSFRDDVKKTFFQGRILLRARGGNWGKEALPLNAGHEKGPIPAAVREGRGLWGASPGCADVACRCLGMKRVSVSLHRVPKDRPCTGGHPECLAWYRRRWLLFPFLATGKTIPFLAAFYSGNLDGVRVP